MLHSGGYFQNNTSYISHNLKSQKRISPYRPHVRKYLDIHRFDSSAALCQMKAKLKILVNLHMGNYVNQVHHTINTGESREVKIKLILLDLPLHLYAGNMLFCVMNIFTSR